MQIKFTKREKEIFHKIQLLSGKPYDDVRSVFEGFLYYSVLSYLEKEPIIFPYFGEIKIKYVKDIVTKRGREAVLETSFEESDLLKRTIGQIEDKEESDLEVALKEKINKEIEKLI
jgi:hypothetical protein